MKSKKAQGLPMETIIIAIIVIVVLVITLVFFIGGTSSIAQKIRDLFSGATAGTDKQTATQFCQDYCGQGRYSSWCTKSFKIDMNSDGVADKNDNTKQYINFYCGNPTGQNAVGDLNKGTLGLTCPEAQTECQGTI